MFIALKNALENQSAENIKNLLGALGTANGESLVGFAGDVNVSDFDLADNLSNLSGVLAEKIAGDDAHLKIQIEEGLKKVAENLKFVDKEGTLELDKNNTSYDVTNESDINITIGGDGVEPLLIGSVGADRLINSSMGLKLGPLGGGVPLDLSLVRKNNLTVTVDSGNLISFVGGSSAINLGGVSVEVLGGALGAVLQGHSTTVKLDGNTQINLNGSSTSAAVMAGGSAIAVSGQANSFVTGSSEINVGVDTVQGKGFKGLNVGLIGGGLSVATLGGSSNAIVGDSTKPTETATTINLNSGISGLVMGGGIAAAADISQVESVVTGIEGIGDNIKFDQELIHKGGTATTESQNINIKVGSGATVFGLMGGATAVAYQVEDATTASKATASVKDVNITIGEEGKGSAFTKADSKDKA